MYVIGIQKLCNYGINSIEKKISQLASSDNISIFSLSRLTIHKAFVWTRLF